MTTKRVVFPKPSQPTIISRQTARSLQYLENHGLASFQNCNLVVYVVRGPSHHRDKTGDPNIPHRLAV